MLVLQGGRSVVVAKAYQALTSPPLTGLISKAVITLFLWGCCLFAWFHGELPKVLHLQFRQHSCLDSTAIVAFLVPVRRNGSSYGLNVTILMIYVR